MPPSPVEQRPATGRPEGGPPRPIPPVSAPEPALATEPERTPPPPPSPPPSAEQPGPPRPAVDWLAPIRRWVFGGNTIVKVGVGILFIGLAFLAKFASEHVRIPIEIRLALIALAAIALLIFGWRLRHRRPGYAEVLQGGAVGALYLTLFAAFKLYGVLAVGPVFGLMVAVAALSAALAVLQNARALAVIGALGGFATPILISTGQGNYLALFTYYLVLDLGIAAVAWYRTWRALNLIGFGATFIVATAWGVLQYRPEHYLASQGFLVAFFLLFIAIMLMPVRAGAPEGRVYRADRWVTGSFLFGLPTVAFALQYGLVQDVEYGVALSALVLAAFYVGLARWARHRAELAVAFEAALAIAIVFLTLVIPFALDARSTTGAWALEGAGLVWLGFRQARRLPRLFGYLLLLLAGAAMLHAWDLYGPPTSVASATFINALLAGAASIAAAYFVARRPAAAAEPGTGPTSLEPMAEPWLIGWGTIWLLLAAVIEIDAVVPNGYALASLLTAVSVIALSYSLLHHRLRWPRIGTPVMGHVALHGVGLLAAATALDRPLQAGGWWAWPLFLVVHAVVLRLVAPGWHPLARAVAHALGALILAGLGALEGRAITGSWGDPSSAWPWLGWMVVPAALLFLLLRPNTMNRWPVAAAPAAYRNGAGAMLAVGLVFWTLVANARSNGSAAPLPHLPLVNPLDLGVGAALIAAWRWLGSTEHRAGRDPLRIATVVATFAWLNAILLRAFNHYGGVPYQFDSWSRSLPVQTGITLLWTATALVVMWLSARRTARLAWMGGAGLLGAVVVKLLLVDLSGTGTVLRIVSFVGVGVLMLIIGYVAPLPPRGEAHATE